MIFKYALSLVALGAAASLGQAHAAAAGFDDLLARVPSSANTLVVLNVEKAFSSSIALKEGWKNAYAERFEATPLLVPPDGLRFVMASEMDFEFMKPQWEVAVVEVEQDRTAERIAERTGGSVDSLSGLPAVLAPFDAYIVRFAPRIFGVFKPANRQQAMRWVRNSQLTTKQQLSPYLREAAGYAEQVGTEIIMALDMQHVVRIEDVRAAMKASPTLKGTKVDLDRLSELLAGIRGMTLGVRTTTGRYGRLKVDFSQDAAILSGVAKPLLLEVIGEAGAMIDDFRGWSERVEGNQVSIEGELTREGMRRLFSFLELDASGITAKEKAKGPAETASTEKTQSPPPTMAYTTKKYFDGTEQYLRGLRREKSVSIGQIGLWMQKYANRIDRLPILGVDPDMVTYGKWVAASLNEAAAAIQGIGIQSEARTRQIYPEYQGTVQVDRAGPVARYGASGGYRLYGASSVYADIDIRNIDAERRAVRYEERAKGATAARQIMAQITSEGSKIRTRMTEKYQIEF